MNTFKAFSLNQEQKEQITHLWNTHYPVSLRYDSPSEFDDFLNSIEDSVHYLHMADNVLAGWMAIFKRNEEIWFSIILDTEFQRKGIGQKLLDIAKNECRTLHGWVVDHDKCMKSDGTPYISPIPFYIKNGFKVLNGIRINTEKLNAVKIRWVSK